MGLSSLDIDIFLLFVHVSSRYDTDGGTEVAHREGYVQETPVADETEDVVPYLVLAVVNVIQNQ